MNNNFLHYYFIQMFWTTIVIVWLFKGVSNVHECVIFKFPTILIMPVLIFFAKST